MPSTRPSTAIWSEMAERIGCDIPTIKAVFEVEAAGRFYESNGKLPRRFEPHHFPREHWGRLGFAPRQGQAAWRASLALRTSARRRMFDIAESIDAEATYRASSWGAPQIMGFNCRLAGFATATEMVDAFEQGADEQIHAFVEFCESANLTTHLRSQNWFSFASGYNGNGQAAHYAALIESAYRRQSGGQASSPVLRLGSRGDAVREMQEMLAALNYTITPDGVFGDESDQIVRAFQAAESLVVDGVAGATTLRRLEERSGSQLEVVNAETPTTANDRLLDKVVERGTAVLGSGGAVGLLASINENAQTIIIGGVVAGAVLLGAIWLLKKKG